MPEETLPAFFMSDHVIIEEAAMQLKNDWELQLPDVISEEEIIAQLAGRIVRLLDKGPESFFQLMYRLDISEKKLNAVLHDTDVAREIARLIYKRQVQKIQTRALFKNHTNNEDPDLAW